VKATGIVAAAVAIVSASIVVVAITLAAQDKYTLKSPSGISFSEFSEAPSSAMRSRSSRTPPRVIRMTTCTPLSAEEIVASISAL